ncbi:unnamed protein product, partial [Mesorhabditis spiculigera]
MILLVVGLVLGIQPTLAIEIRQDFKWPGPSSSVLGEFANAAIATDHTRCAGIGKDTMQRGGNAADAAVAAQICLGVVNPQSSGLGGGFIMTLYNKTKGRCISIDARETAPAASYQDVYVGNPNSSLFGFNAVATPGELAGLWHVYQTYGSGKVTWKSLLEPSIRICEEGVVVTEYMATVSMKLEHQIRAAPSMKTWINPKTGNLYQTGEVLFRPKLAATLKTLAQAVNPVQEFYHGTMAKTISKEFAENGGMLTLRDLKDYKVRVYESPIVNDHFRGDLVICGPPPPSSFAVTQLLISVMSQLYPHTQKFSAELLHSDPVYYHNLMEAMKFTYAQRTLFGDNDFVTDSWDKALNLTQESFTRWVVENIRDHAQPTSSYGGINQTLPVDAGTSQVSIVDAGGNGVSVTTTINQWFGACVESVKYGILWNDEMDDFSTPGMSNGFGYAPSYTNFIQPGKRPMSSMSPLIIYNRTTKDIRMVVGASGGSKIISSVAHAVIRPLVFGETIKEASDAPRLHNQFTPDETQVGGDFPKELKEILANKYGQKFVDTFGFEGVAQVIDIPAPGKIHAIGDWRRKTPQEPAGF